MPRAPAAHVAPDAPALTPTHQTEGSRSKPRQNATENKHAKGGFKKRKTKGEKEKKQESKLPPWQIRAKQPDSQQHIAESFKKWPISPTKHKHNLWQWGTPLFQWASVLHS